MNSERGLITYSKIITAAGPEDSRPRLCNTFRKYLGQAEGPEQACVLTQERRLGSAGGTAPEMLALPACV